MQKIFIAGGSGYIGKELISFLKKKPNLQLHICYFKNKLLLKKKANCFTYKIDLSKKTLVKKLKRINADIIINLAAFTNPSKNELKPKKSFIENVIINRNIVNYCNKYKKKLIFTSTDKVYGGNVKTPSETEDLKPNNIYGKNKLLCEKDIKKKLKKYLILRYASVYSENINTNNSFANQQVNYIRKRKKVYVATNVYRLFMSAEHLCDIIYKSIQKKIVGTFNVGTAATSYYGLVRSICLKKKIPTKFILHKTKIFTNPQYLIPSLKKINYFLKMNK